MPRNLKTVAAASALVVGLLAAPALYAQAAGPEEGGMMGESGSMMGESGSMMGGGGMMHQGGPMMGGDMMGMMAQMNRMMATCTEMMQAHMRDHGHGDPTEPGRMPRHDEAPALPPASPEDRG